MFIWKPEQHSWQEERLPQEGSRSPYLILTASPDDDGDDDDDNDDDIDEKKMFSDFFVFF